MRRSATTRALLGLLVVASVLVAGWLVSPEGVLALAGSVADDPWRFALLVAVLYAVRPLFAWPTTPLGVVVGFGFGIAMGVPIAIAGAVLTTIPTYLFVRWVTPERILPTARPGRDRNGDTSNPGSGIEGSSATPDELVEPRPAGDGCTGEPEGADGADEPASTPTPERKSTTDGVDVIPDRGVRLLDRSTDVVVGYYDRVGPIRGVVVTRLVPIPTDVGTVAATISGVRLSQLLIGTAIGEVPWAVAGVIVGASAATITLEGLGAVGLPLAVACVLAALVLLAGPLYRYARPGGEVGTPAGRP